MDQTPKHKIHKKIKENVGKELLEGKNKGSVLNDGNLRYFLNIQDRCKVWKIWPLDINMEVTGDFGTFY